MMVASVVPGLSEWLVAGYCCLLLAVAVAAHVFVTQSSFHALCRNKLCLAAAASLQFWLLFLGTVWVKFPAIQLP